MKAFVLEYGKLFLKEMEEPECGKNDVVVKLKAAGLNRRDLMIPKRHGDDKEALILGSDGAGIVEAVGEMVTRFQPGDEVIINPSLGWFENTPAPPANYEILGMPDHGTFAEKIVIQEGQLEKKPSYLSWQEAGVLALSALTGYRALFTKGQLQSGANCFHPGSRKRRCHFPYSICETYWCEGYRHFPFGRKAEKGKRAWCGSCPRNKQ